MSVRKKTSVQKDLLFLSISSFVVVVAWVGFNLYHSWVTTTITPELQVQISPITPDFDMTTFAVLKTRKQVVPIVTLSGISVEPTGTTQQTVSTQQSAPITISPTPAVGDIPVTINGE